MSYMDYLLLNTTIPIYTYTFAYVSMHSLSRQAIFTQNELHQARIHNYLL